MKIDRFINQVARCDTEGLQRADEMSHRFLFLPIACVLWRFDQDLALMKQAAEVA